MKFFLWIVAMNWQEIISGACKTERTSWKTEKSLQDLCFYIGKIKCKVLCVFVPYSMWDVFEVGVFTSAWQNKDLVSVFEGTFDVFFTAVVVAIKSF